MYESRHMHALKRKRNSVGNFLKSPHYEKYKKKICRQLPSETVCENQNGINDEVDAKNTESGDLRCEHRQAFGLNENCTDLLGQLQVISKTDKQGFDIESIQTFNANIHK